MRSHLRESQVLAERDIECDCVSQSGDPESGGQRDGRQIAIRTGQWSGGNPSTMVSAGNSSAVLLQNRLVFASAAVEGSRVRISVFLKRIRIWTWTWTLTWTRDWEGILDYRREFRGRTRASTTVLVTRRRSSFPFSAPRIARDGSALPSRVAWPHRARSWGFEYAS